LLLRVERNKADGAAEQSGGKARRSIGDDEREGAATVVRALELERISGGRRVGVCGTAEAGSGCIAMGFATGRPQIHGACYGGGGAVYGGGIEQHDGEIPRGATEVVAPRKAIGQFVLRKARRALGRRRD
jgi:hypothetical protein